ncbi:hypothetical protein Lal_00027007 [Lupinus albus]|nr:hypothetical protein Lal_00027007 [Lupinus albus]
MDKETSTQKSLIPYSKSSFSVHLPAMGLTFTIHKQHKGISKEIPLVKVLWSQVDEEDATWEVEHDMREDYPHLFESRIIVSVLGSSLEREILAWILRLDAVRKELVKLTRTHPTLTKHRDYINTWMHALDAANQQVQVELRRLSNRLDYMNLDDENAEPQS